MIKTVLGWVAIILLVTNCASKEEYESPNDESLVEAENAYLDGGEQTALDMGSTAETNWSDQKQMDSPEVGSPSIADTAALEQDAAFGEPVDMPAVQTASEREMSSVPFKQGMYDFPKDCFMKASASNSSASAGKIRANKSLWVEPFNGLYSSLLSELSPHTRSAHSYL